MPLYSITNALHHTREFLEAATPQEVIDKLLTEWVAGDTDLYGIMTFLSTHGVKPPMKDEDVLEGENEPELESAADAVRKLVAESDEKAVSFFTSLRDIGVTNVLPGSWSVTADLFAPVLRYLTERLGNEDAAKTWLAVPENQHRVLCSFSGLFMSEVELMDDNEIATLFLQADITLP